MIAVDDSAVTLAAAFALGLFGSSHCLGMCGGISAALGMSIGQRHAGGRRAAYLSLCQLGRILSYAIIGTLLALAAGLLSSYQQAMFALRLFAGLLLVLMGLYIAGLPTVLPWLERAGSALWTPLQQLANRSLRGPAATGALAVGLAWGWLPCGLVYSTAAWAGSSADWRQAAALMFAFGLGTTPAVLGSGLAASGFARWLQNRALRTLVGLLILVFGVWTVYMAYRHGLQPPGSSAHHHH